VWLRRQGSFHTSSIRHGPADGNSIEHPIQA
jgi:hypothetical protein